MGCVPLCASAHCLTVVSAAWRCVLQESEITHISDTIDLTTYPVEDSYDGPRMEGERGGAVTGDGAGEKGAGMCYLGV